MMWFSSSGVSGEATETLGMKNGELNEDAIGRKESENSVEALVEPSRP